MMCFMALNALADFEQSICYGQTYDGMIKNASQMPKKGKNYIVFSSLAWYLGRTYVHSEAKKVMVATYDQLATEFPHHVFMYAETGWANGKQFKPHKTHQNGLSVDFMVPVKNSKAEPSLLPVRASNKWGYDIDFSSTGEFDMFQIDFEIMAEHLKLLYEISRKQGFSIKRVYFDPRLQPLLFKTSAGQFIQKHIQFNKQQAWVRHDEHYHVDFDIKCEKITH